MTNATPDITVTRTLNSTVYESTEYEIILATADRRGPCSWRSSCYWGPDTDESEQETHDRRSDAETVAWRHATAIIDAL